jgi:hypothetical protein
MIDNINVQDRDFSSFLLLIILRSHDINWLFFYCYKFTPRCMKYFLEFIQEDLYLSIIGFLLIQDKHELIQRRKRDLVYYD